ncbi:UNVERIFIED_CONTAM: Peroxisome biogenesis protein 12 [Sesamum radiatum]|uniref:Peroxisome biogenesis protein 12 n=1 Tax=Sesamum radiatum TaxID=300843 RepID=A0AAW2NAA6_SESRA
MYHFGIDSKTQVVLPYLRSKLQSIYNKEREATLQASLWGDSDERFDSDFVGGGDNTFGSRDNLDNEASARARWIKRLRKTVGACYPWLHAGNEGPYKSFAT